MHEPTLRRCEQTDLAFPDLDLRWFEAAAQKS